jgi:hypothetical protein
MTARSKAKDMELLATHPRWHGFALAQWSYQHECHGFGVLEAIQNLSRPSRPWNFEQRILIYPNRPKYLPDDSLTFLVILRNSAQQGFASVAGRLSYWIPRSDGSGHKAFLGTIQAHQAASNVLRSRSTMKHAHAFWSPLKFKSLGRAYRFHSQGDLQEAKNHCTRLVDPQKALPTQMPPIQKNCFLYPTPWPPLGYCYCPVGSRSLASFPKVSARVSPKELLPNSTFHFISRPYIIQISYILYFTYITYTNFICITFINNITSAISIYKTYIILQHIHHLHHLHQLQVVEAINSYKCPAKFLHLQCLLHRSCYRWSASS